MINLNDIRLIPDLTSVKREKISDEIYFSKEYSDYISNSRLKLINPDQSGSPITYLNGFINDSNSSLNIGTGVHCLLLQPNDFYLAPDIGKPSAKLGQVIEEIFHNRLSKQSIYNSIINACKKIHYYEDSLTKNKIKTIIKKGLNFYNKLKLYADDNKAIILCSNERNTVKECIHNLTSSKQITSLLNPVDVFGDSIISYNEDAFFININGYHEDKTCVLKVKMKADNWSIDVDNKIITLNDLKTTSSPLSKFMNEYGSFHTFHYSRQFAYYLWVLLRYCEKEYGYNKDEWTVKCNVIVSETRGTNKCCVFSINKEHLESGRREFCRLLKMVAYCEMYGYSDDYIFE